MSKDIRIQRLSGEALIQYIPELARLRIEVFRDFPYLYDGDYEYEKKYLQTYIDCPESVIVLAFDGDKIIGASTAIPLKYETDDVKKPFIENGYAPDDVFYCGESVLNKAYRGLGIGVKFFEQRMRMISADSNTSPSAASNAPPITHVARPTTCRWMPSGTSAAISNIPN